MLTQEEAERRIRRVAQMRNMLIECRRAEKSEPGENRPAG